MTGTSETMRLTHVDHTLVRFDHNLPAGQLARNPTLVNQHFARHYWPSLSTRPSGCSPGAGAAIGRRGPRQPCPRSAGVGAGLGRPGAYGNSRRAPTNPQGFVTTGSHVASEGLQVGAPVSTHRGLVGSRLMRV